MATLPTPEEAAVAILAIFVRHFNLRSGEVLRENSFSTIWYTRGLAFGDLESGLQHALTQGWIEIQPDGESYKLTEAGFAKA